MSFTVFYSVEADTGARMGWVRLIHLTGWYVWLGYWLSYWLAGWVAG